jgi:RNA polymerase sigma-70 factor, ECF subfamily
MGNSTQDKTPRVSAVMNLASYCSSRDFSNKQALEVRALDIVAAARAGSTAAFDDLQRLYSAQLFKVILRITKHREDAEDALQDTFLRAFLALDQFQARSSVHSWLTRIAINSALMILRRQRTRREAIPPSSFKPEDPYAQLDIKDTAPNPEQACEIRELNDELLNAIQKLKPPLRWPIEIQLKSELSMKELADVLEISEAAVKSRLHRARNCLALRITRNCGAKAHMPPSLIGKSLVPNLPD